MLPPQDLDAEESVLGAMMLSEPAVATVTEIIRDPRDFYREAHAVIYRAMLGLHARSEPIDAVTVADQLASDGKLEGVGGRAFVHGLPAAVPAAANARHYARIVHEQAVLRRLIAAGTEVAQLGYDRPGEVRELLDQAESIVFKVAQEQEASELLKIDGLLVEEFEKIERLADQTDGVTGAPSGLRDLDRMTSGFQPSNLVILAARPSMGKTSLALGIARSLGVEAGRPVAVFSLEMSRSEIAQRLMCAQARVDSSKLRTGRMREEDWTRLMDACDRLSRAPIYIDDSAGINVMEIRSKARRLKAREPGLAMILVDYLQLMGSSERTESRVQEISQISRALKILARDLDIPVLALSQLSRAVESRTDKRPLLSDLRESGSIEQDADLVMFIYRDEYYQKEKSEDPGVAELILAKHRNGAVGTVRLSFVERYTVFSDMARAD